MGSARSGRETANVERSKGIILIDKSGQNKDVGRGRKSESGDDTTRPQNVDLLTLSPLQVRMTRDQTQVCPATKLLFPAHTLPTFDFCKRPKKRLVITLSSNQVKDVITETMAL